MQGDEGPDGFGEEKEEEVLYDPAEPRADADVDADADDGLLSKFDDIVGDWLVRQGHVMTEMRVLLMGAK
jgi:hypothetical protein